MRRHHIVVATAVLVSVIVGAVLLVLSNQEKSQDEVNPASLRRLWASEGGPVPTAAYVLTAAAKASFGGTFGVDLSHYTFDRKNSDKKCKTQDGYLDSSCSCTANWEAISDSGIKYVYAKASDGIEIDLSFKRVWSELSSRHQSKTLFRGAYHFLRPGISAEKQAATFLSAIGAVNGKQPEQLLPVLDIEWSNREIVPGTADYSACPSSRMIKNERTNRLYCDMWYLMSPIAITAIAREWISRVEAATGLPVAIYTNPAAWWNAVMTEKEDFLVRDRPIWTSRYTSVGPKYDPGWTAQGGSLRWGMAPLPRGASYPAQKYDVPHLWQFTEEGNLVNDFLVCDGRPTKQSVDLNWMPVSETEYPIVYPPKQVDRRRWEALALRW
jgi:GH25 family lysozyme M1 (1,4-beta-N-acetylmuramidase)